MAERRRPSWGTLLKWVFALAVIAFGVAYFVRNGPALLDALREARPAPLSLAHRRPGGHGTAPRARRP